MSKQKQRKRSRKKGRSTERSNTSYVGHTPSSYTGLDPMHTIRSAAYMEGSFLRNLFTGQFKTRNPLYLLLMGIFGVGAILPTFCAIIELTTTSPTPPVVYEADGVIHVVNNSMPFPVENLVCLVPIALVGVGLLINLGVNIIRNYINDG